jgi:carbamoyl-phosphate synthase large subunit
MEISYDHSQFERYIGEAFLAAQGQPVLIDRFLEGATEVDVDAIADGTHVVVAGIMEHIEKAGVHSGDSACAIPPYSLPDSVVGEMHEATAALARELEVVGLMNVQFAVKHEQGQYEVYIIEVNPRASRTVPFVAKATGFPAAKVAAKVMAGVSLAEQGVTEDPLPIDISVKEAVFPFIKFAGVDIVLGPEMRSTGEVMGVSSRFSMAFAKSQMAAGTILPKEGNIFISVALRLVKMGYPLLATRGTAATLAAENIETTQINKIAEGKPNLLDYLADANVALVMNTPLGKGAHTDEGKVRAAAVQADVPCVTTMEAATAVVLAMEALREEKMMVQALQDRCP